VSHVTVNGADVFALALTEPRVGVWTAALSCLDGAADLSQGLEIRIADSVAWRGVVRSSGVHNGVRSIAAVGGKGGLSTVLEPKSYQGVPLRIPLADIVAGAGETLSPACDAGLLGIMLRRWSRIRQSAAFSLAALLDAVGGPAWRILPDGTLWVGTESWAEVTAPYIISSAEPHQDVATLVSERPDIHPGQSVGGRHIASAEHRIDRRTLVTRVWFEGAAA
jgi:hypothetical protein